MPHRFFTLLAVLSGLYALLALAGCAGPSQGWPDYKGQGKTETPVAQPAPPLSAGGAGRTLAPGEKAKIALLLPLSGPAAPVGQSMQNAAQQAVFDTAPDTLELHPYDTKGTPAGAAEAMRTALGGGSHLVMGPLLASSVRAAAPLAAQGNVNMISFTTDAALAGGPVYVMGFLPDAQARRMASYAAQRGIRSAAIIAPPGAYGDIVTAAFAESAAQYGISIVQTLRPAPGEAPSDLRLPARPDALFVPLEGEALARTAAALSAQGMGPGSLLWLGTGLWDTPQTLSEPALAGAYFAAPPAEARARFEQSYRALYGQPPERLATLAYDAVSLASLLARKGRFDAGALHDPNGYAGVDGIFRFDAGNRVERGLAVLRVENGAARTVEAPPRSFQ